MFRTIIKARQEHAFSAKIIDEFLTMIGKSEEMLAYAFQILTGEVKDKNANENIYLKDQSINFTERDIRKRVLIHLSVNPNANLPEYLALISIAKDAERLGDYVKNFYELKQYLNKMNGDSPLFKEVFGVMGSELLTLFETVTGAFRTCDREKARSAINQGHKIAKQCENTIDEIINTIDDVPHAVVLVLGTRYMKRIARHLANVASSVVNPMPDLDFSTRPKK